MHPANKFVPTSVGTAMLTMLNDIHKQRRIAIFAGPPGIGKTTALRQFASEHPGHVVRLKFDRTGKQGVGARMVMQAAVKALGEALGLGSYVYLDTYQLRRQLSERIAQWASQSYEPEQPLLTFVIDEAQNLSRDAIETLRFWNDRDECYAPFPIGLAFVGNNEFALLSSKGRQSTISEAVADRARYKLTLDYSCIENSDIRLILAAHNIADPAAVSTVIKHYSSARQSRSLRSLVEDKIPLMHDFAGAGPVTCSIAAEALAA